MPDGEDRLDSWKEIAAYLGREVRTVQLWEKSEGLPVHRQQHSRQGSVYAFRTELDVWRNARRSPAPASQPGLKKPIAWTVAAILAISSAAFVLWKTRRAVSPVPSSVAVLPFLDLSPQRDSEYFSDGLTEEIIDALSRVPNLRVVARTSSFAFKGKNTDIREIGKQLGVNAVIEGSVRKSGDSLRITAQLNRVSDGSHIWSRTYDQQLRDIFSTQREISEAIALGLRAGKAPGQLKREPTKDMDAYRLYQEGRYYFNKFEAPETNFKAIEQYQKAIVRDPGFAAAWAGIADAYSYLAENLVKSPREVMPKAKEAAQKALALDDESAEAHTSLGIVKLDYELDIPGSQSEFRRALQINPGFGWARHWYGHSLEAQNRVEDALHEMQAARDLDPLSIPINWDIAGELMILNRYDEAFRLLDKASELFPAIFTFDYLRALADWRQGRFGAAHEVVEILKKRPEANQEPSFIALLAAEAAHNGNSAQARALLAQVEEMRKTQYVEPFTAIEVCKALHDHGQLAVWLKRAREEHSSFFVYVQAYAPLWGLDQTDLAELEK